MNLAVFLMPCRADLQALVESKTNLRQFVLCSHTSDSDLGADGHPKLILIWADLYYSCPFCCGWEEDIVRIQQDNHIAPYTYHDKRHCEGLFAIGCQAISTSMVTQSHNILALPTPTPQYKHTHLTKYTNGAATMYTDFIYPFVLINRGIKREIKGNIWRPDW